MDVREVELEPMRVVSFLATGTSPEKDAWAKLFGWARPLGMVKPETRFFGFNNPNPSPGKAEYGYEVWMTVPKNFKDPKADVKDFPGGRYLVHRVEVPKGKFEVIFQGWQDLVKWQKRNGYRCADNICLEESVRTDRKDLEFILDLYHPVEPK